MNVTRDNSALVSSLFIYQATASTIVSDTPCRLNQSASSMPYTTSWPPSSGQSHLPFSSLPPSVIARSACDAAIQGHAPKHGSMLPWIAAPKPARNDELLEAGGGLGQMRSPSTAPENSCPMQVWIVPWSLPLPKRS